MLLGKPHAPFLLETPCETPFWPLTLWPKLNLHRCASGCSRSAHTSSKPYRPFAPIPHLYVQTQNSSGFLLSVWLQPVRDRRGGVPLSNPEMPTPKAVESQKNTATPRRYCKELRRSREIHAPHTDHIMLTDRLGWLSGQLLIYFLFWH